VFIQYKGRLGMKTQLKVYGVLLAVFFAGMFGLNTSF
jgi:hypothetical protein